MTHLPPSYDCALAAPPCRRRALITAAGAVAAVTTAAAVMTLAGCGGAAPSPPSAWALAHKLPGCSPAAAPGTQLAKFAREVVACNAGQFSGVTIATFGSQKSARAWYVVNTEFVRLAAAGHSTGPLGVMGNDWAAVLNAGALMNGGTSQAETIQHYLGGKLGH